MRRADRAATGGAVAADGPPQVMPSPQSYTPRHLAEKIPAGRDALAGERKQVTVLFADVAGSTAISSILHRAGSTPRGTPD